MGLWAHRPTQLAPHSGPPYARAAVAEVDPNGVLADSDDLVREGRILEAIDLLSAANRRSNAFALEQRLVELRHRACERFHDARPVGDWPRPVTDAPLALGSPPACRRAALSAELLGSAIQQHGCLIVRGLLSPEWCAVLRRDIDLSIDAARDWVSAPEPPERSEWFSPFGPAEHELDRVGRRWLVDVATAYTAESPRTLFHLLQAFDEARVDRLLIDYLGERPAFSLIKSAFRRTAPDATGGWHQDGYVAGDTTRTVNVWVAVTSCGSTAPGLDILPRRMHSMLPTRKDLPIDFVIADEVVAELARQTPVSRPEFQAGDAILFDQWLVHRTGWGGAFTGARYGFECWFFAPSTFPMKWYPFVY